ncbi:MAG TPA: 2-C-methyl-D-erythritol 2,4-cyclodiphosphate synthase [Opitutaceae bacterium]|jgi:2-C-methyl-D-erythritol 2,4-cyclodiphosphate synthase
MTLRIGHGYDIHKTKIGRPLVIGGVRFESDFGLDGHSDADCLTHAVCDAFLGAAGLPDIGNFFPDTDPTWAGADSQVLLRRVIQVLREGGWRPVNIDATLIAERPRISPRIADMKAALAASTGLPSDSIGVKATTNEGVGDLGRGLAIAAHSVALIERE